MADKLTGDELQAYGFKRIVEELAGIRQELTRTNETLAQISKAVRATGDTAAKIEHNTFIANDTLIQTANTVDKIQLNTFTTEMNVIRIGQKLNGDKDGPMEGI